MFKKLLEEIVTLSSQNDSLRQSEKFLFTRILTQKDFYQNYFSFIYNFVDLKCRNPKKNSIK